MASNLRLAAPVVKQTRATIKRQNCDLPQKSASENWQQKLSEFTWPFCQVDDSHTNRP
jgi:hypothetical protein